MMSSNMHRENERMRDRITNLEIQLMHHENTIQQLSDVIARQQQEVDRLQRDLKLLTDQMQKITPSLMCAPEEEEPPPHY
jgi:uncharacterized coiled-coil protein SlyX